MRVLQIAHGLYPYANAGVEIYTHTLSRELIKRGHDVLVAAPIRGDPRQAISVDIPVHPLPAPNKAHYGEDPDSSHRRSTWSSLQEVMGRFRPEIIHVQHLIHMGWETLSELQKMGIPFVVSLADYWYLCRGIKRMCDGSPLVCTQRCMYQSLRKPLRFFYEYYRTRMRRKACVRLLNRIGAPLLSPSQRAADIFREAGVHPGRIVVQSWGIDVAALKASARAPFNGPIRFGYIGKLLPEKGVEVLVRSFQKLRIPASLHVYGGDGEQFVERLQNMAVGANVYFHGPYNHADITRILSTLDVVVVPSLWEEVYGLVIQEALAARKVVIASAVGGLPQTIIHGVNGFLFPSGDDDALAIRMTDVAEQYPRLWKELRFDLSLKDIRCDGEQIEQLYEWTCKKWDGLCKGHILPAEFEWSELSSTLAEFLGEDRMVVHEKLKREWQNPGSSVREAWKKSLPVKDQEIKDFYKDTDSYIYDLVMVHRTSERHRWRQAAAYLLKKYGVRKLLDYGGGCGDDSLLFSQIGIDCTLYDCGRLIAAFARFRAKRVGVHLDVVEHLPSDVRYDAIYCTEALEHVPEPLREVDNMRDLLCLDGILFLTHSFDLIGEAYPSHLERHKGLSPTFVGEMEARGFELEEVFKVPGNQFLVFRYKGKDSSNRVVKAVKHSEMLE